MLERCIPYIESHLRNTLPTKEKSYRFLSSYIVKRYLTKYKLFKLKKAIHYSYNNVPFYHEIFNHNNLKPSSIKSFKDLVKIPFTTMNDLKKPELFFAVPESAFVKIFSSSGTTGKPKKIFFTKNDLDRLISSNATGMHLLYRMDKNDRVRITYDIGYGINDWGVRYCTERAVEKAGALGVVTGHHLPPDQEFHLLTDYKITTIIGTPSYLMNLSCEMEKKYDLHALKIKNLLVGAEPLPQAIRNRLEMIWNADVYQSYGLVEMGTSIGGECNEKNGIHIAESDFFVEIVDIKSGEQKEDGDLGEIVITSLSREGMPLLRYRTHDIGVIMPERCPCGLPFKKIKIKGRSDDMITIGSGDNIFPNLFDEIILSHPQVIDYQIILDRKSNKDHMTFIIETSSISEEMKNDIMNSILKLPEISSGVYDSNTIEKPDITLVKPHTLEHTSNKLKRILDNRNLFD